MNHIDRKEELKNCTMIKTILMLIIVLYHSMIIFAGEGTWGPCTRVDDEPAIGYIAEWFNSFHVYTFTLISGYIFCFVKYERGGYSKYLPFLVSKAKRLLVPYVFIATLWVAPINYYFLPHENIFSMFVLGTSPRQLWFLLMLFWVFTIFWLISNIVYLKPLWGGIIVCILYGLSVFAPEYYCFDVGMQYVIFFYIGFIFRKYDFGNRFFYRIPGYVYLVLDVLLFAGIEMIISRIGNEFKLVVIALNVALHICGAGCTFVFLQKLIMRFCQENRVLRYLSVNSMTIYLVHQQLIYFSIKRFNGIVPSIVLVMYNFAFSIAVSTTLAVLFSKTRVTRFLVGMNISEVRHEDS